MKYSYWLLAMALIARASFSGESYFSKTVFEDIGETSVQHHTIKANLFGNLTNIEIRQNGEDTWLIVNFTCEWPRRYRVLPGANKISGHVMKKVQEPYRANSIHLKQITWQEQVLFSLKKEGHAMGNYDHVIENEGNAKVMIEGITFEIKDSLGEIIKALMECSKETSLVSMMKGDFDRLEERWRQEKNDRIQKIVTDPQLDSCLRDHHVSEVNYKANKKLRALRLLQNILETREYKIEVLATIDVTKKVEKRSLVKAVLDENTLALDWLDANENYLTIERHNQKLIVTVRNGDKILYFKSSDLTNKKRITEQLSDFLTPGSGFDLARIIDGDSTYLTYSFDACRKEYPQINNNI